MSSVSPSWVMMLQIYTFRASERRMASDTPSTSRLGITLV